MPIASALIENESEAYAPTLPSPMAMKRILSSASDALEISSRRKISCGRQTGYLISTTSLPSCAMPRHAPMHTTRPCMSVCAGHSYLGLVQRVDDDVHQAVDLGLELELLARGLDGRKVRVGERSRTAESSHNIRDLITFCNMPNHCAFLELISGLRTTRVANSKSRPGANGLWLHHPTSAWMDMEKGISSKQ